MLVTGEGFSTVGTDVGPQTGGKVCSRPTGGA